MARKAEPGIRYYPMDSNHVYNHKVKLLVNEFDSHGYWIYQCINCEITSKKGYYIDLSDPDVLILFASDVCKKPVSLVKEVIAGCIRRGLYEKSVYDTFKVLTSDRIQDNYVEAKKELRRKGYVVDLIREYWVIEIENEKNLKFISLDGSSSAEEMNNSGEETEFSREEVQQSRVEESRVEEKRRESNKFIPPSPSDVENFFREKITESGWSVKECREEAKKFIGKYNSVGWVMGKAQTPILDWKSTAEFWIQKYLEWKLESGGKSQTVIPARSVGQTQKSEPSAEPSPEKKQEIAKEAVIVAFNYFRKNGHYDDYANTVYKSLTVTLHCPFFISFIENKEEFYQKQGLKRINGRTNQAMDMKNAILSTIESNKLQNATDQERVTVEGHKEAVRDFFFHLVEKSLGMEDILK